MAAMNYEWPNATISMGVAVDAFAITPNDSTNLTVPARALWVGVAGNVVVRTMGGSDITFAVASAQLLPVAAQRVLSTGTTATGIIGLV